MIELKNFTPHPNKVFVTELESGPRLSRGIILIDDDMTDRGVRPRWCQIAKIGRDITDVEVGDWVLVEHGRWSHGIDVSDNGQDVKVWHIDFPKAVIVVSKDDPRTTQKTTL